MTRSFAAFYCVLGVLLAQCSAHFILYYPPTIGFDDTLEGTFPCGSFTPDFSADNVTDYYVNGNVVAMESVHPQATWLFRATLDLTAQTNWTSLLPAVQQTGLGDYCEKNIVIPASYAGSKGIIGIVQDAPDGILYQCAAVNFVAGTATSVPSSCKNVTGLSAVFTTDTVLSTLAATSTSTSSSTSATSATTTTSSSSPASTSKTSSANTIIVHSGLGSFFWVLAIGGASLIACFS